MLGVTSVLVTRDWLLGHPIILAPTALLFFLTPYGRQLMSGQDGLHAPARSPYVDVQPWDASEGSAAAGEFAWSRGVYAQSWSVARAASQADRAQQSAAAQRQWPGAQSVEPQAKHWGQQAGAADSASQDRCGGRWRPNAQYSDAAVAASSATPEESVGRWEREAEPAAGTASFDGTAGRAEQQYHGRWRPQSTQHGAALATGAGSAGDRYVGRWRPQNSLPCGDAADATAEAGEEQYLGHWKPQSSALESAELSWQPNATADALRSAPYPQSLHSDPHTPPAATEPLGEVHAGQTRPAQGSAPQPSAVVAPQRNEASEVYLGALAAAVTNFTAGCKCTGGWCV